MQYLLLILAYLIGSFPNGLIAGKLSGVDLQRTGSGNIGATNVARAIGKKAGIIVLLADILKGILACLLGWNQSADFTALCGLLAVCGHCFSIPGILKGGKGVATALGVILFVSPLSALCGLITFAIIFALSKIVSLGSILACTVSALTAFIMMPPEIATPLIIIAILVIARHHSNIKKLMRGEEAKFTPKR